MSGKTVTDKKIDRERKKANAVCEQFYEIHRAPMIWLCDQIVMEDELAKALEPRPLSTMQVRIAFNAYVVAFKKACMIKEEKNGQQARDPA